MATATKFLISSLGIVTLLGIILFLGNGRLDESKMALIPALHGPAFVLRIFLTFWFVPLGIWVFAFIMLKAFDSDQT